MSVSCIGAYVEILPMICRDCVGLSRVADKDTHHQPNERTSVQNGCAPGRSPHAISSTVGCVHGTLCVSPVDAAATEQEFVNLLTGSIHGVVDCRRPFFVGSRLYSRYVGVPQYDGPCSRAPL